jgi:hypothetical protein
MVIFLEFITITLICLHQVFKEILMYLNTLYKFIY